MFPEYRDLISKLKTEDAHFSKLFEKHNDLDHKIKNLESSFAADSEVETLKKEKLKLKDEIYVMLKKHDA
ncbi:YdcH family protein [Entomomonas sp. E2T0]|uniref:YdcH family protein n=1 Tax=Entomomonas sp. E2T0 TaxID=2930213 RepID=UPI002228375A|nr:YdcH family protein [Entomomonas sp. E2T0]UYZ84105.1 YdcH family protein [Entomomonas sp. E2T0]